MPPLTPDELLKALIELRDEAKLNSRNRKFAMITHAIEDGKVMAYDKVINLINEKK